MSPLPRRQLSGASGVITLGGGTRGSGQGITVYARARIGRGTSAQGFYAQRLRFRDLAFDIGAWRGQHTAAMLKRGVRVVAVEPQSELARQLERDFPAATVLSLGVSDRPGQATLITSSTNSDLATLNPAQLDDPFLSGAPWDGEETIRLTTLDELIAEFGLPAFVKIDTEGLEDKVLAGLSHPVGQFLFEVRSAFPDVAARSFESLAALGVYEYRLMRNDPRARVAEPWVFGPPVSPAGILADLPNWGDVYARRIDMEQLHLDQQGSAAMPEPRPDAWGKIPLLQRLLEAFDVVVWLDVDTVILDDSRDLASELDDGAWQALVAHRGRR